MLSERKQNLYQIATGALLVIIIMALSSLIIVRSQTETTSVSLTNEAPFLHEVKICNDNAVPFVDCNTDIPGDVWYQVVLLTPGTGASRDFKIYAEVVDLNGADNISTVTAALFHNDDIGVENCNQASDEDKNNCYTNIAGGTGIGICTVSADQSGLDFPEYSALYECPVTLDYWIDPTPGFSEEFFYAIFVEDGEGEMANGGQFLQIAEVASINFGSSTIAYGELSLGATSSPRIAVLGQNYGNVDADSTIQAGSATMTCDGQGSIPSSNQRFGTDDAAYESLASALSTVAQDLDFEISTNDNKLLARTNDAATPTDSVYFGIKIPETGVLGTCTLSATVTTEQQ